MSIAEKHNLYFFALKKVFELHREHKFGKSPDIPSGFSESLCCDLLRLKKSRDRSCDATDSSQTCYEIKATGTKEGKTTISNSNEFDVLIWMFIDFENNSVNIYRLPRNCFSLKGGKNRSSITLSKTANDNSISAEVYKFLPLNQR